MQSFLSDLQPGERAIVKTLPQDQLLSTRLREMGLLSGTEITYIRKAPLGDPLEIKIRGYSLSLRLKDAATISVEKIL
ncbi:MAG: ferrous iron transport protein A [Verrucomicrobia bacterium]|nr:ferrous iron transport protein A [Verrucomicrobiota bacterium]